MSSKNKKFYFFGKRNFLALKLTNFLYFLKRKTLFYFEKHKSRKNSLYLRKQNFLIFQEAFHNFPRSKNEKNFSEKTFCILRNETFQTHAYKTSYISGGKLQNLKIKKFVFFVCLKRCFKMQIQKKKLSYTFSYKEANFSKLKYFVIIIVRRFFSFYNIFFHTQQAFLFHLLRDFCNVHDRIVGFVFFFRKILISFKSLFFVVFLCFLDNIQLVNFQTFLHITKKL